MRTESDVIDALGGSAAVATARGLPLTTVDSWKRRGSIPAAHWPGLVDLARTLRVRGVTLRKLAALAEGRRQPSSRQRAA